MSLLHRATPLAAAALVVAGCSAIESSGPSTVADSAGVSDSATNPESGGDPGDLDGITAAHNKVRASVSPAAMVTIPPLAWSATVAAVAQAWAENCKFEHSDGNYGENLYADTGQGTASDVVDDWASESKDYSYASNSCSGVCGHYTQVVWAKSLRLGCAKQRCTTGSPFGGSGAWTLWVCNYDPPGNFNGERPY